MDCGASSKHELQDIAVDAAAVDLHGIEVSTMGRGLADDPAFFAAAYAAGVLAANMLA
jgi:hypothetical protein